LALHDAVTPAGKPVAAPMPVAPVVAIVIGVSAVFRQSVGEDEGVPAVLSGVTVTVVVTGGPAHVPSVGVIVYTTVPAIAPVAFSVWVMLLPLPFDAPVTPLGTCVHANVAPTGLLVIGIAVTSPEQIVDVGCTVAEGVGLTTIVAVAIAAQPTGVNVTV